MLKKMGHEAGCEGEEQEDVERLVDGVLDDEVVRGVEVAEVEGKEEHVHQDDEDGRPEGADKHLEKEAFFGFLSEKTCPDKTPINNIGCRHCKCAYTSRIYTGISDLYCR